MRGVENYSFLVMFRRIEASRQFCSNFRGVAIISYHVFLLYENVTTDK